MSTIRLVRVVWEDASSLDSETWVTREGAKPATPTIFDHVGWLLELTPEHVVLSDCMGEELMSPRDRIPMGMVKSITEYALDDGRPVPLPKRRRKK